MAADTTTRNAERSFKAMMAAIADNWGWFLALGIVLIVLGLLAIVSPLSMTFAAEQFFGWLILFGGLIQAVVSWRAKSWGGFVVELLIGLFYVLGGIALVSNPLTGIFTLTLVLIVLFIADGIFQTALAIRLRPTPGWGWMLASGVASLLVGMMIWAQLPSSALWAIGLLVGIKLIVNGWNFVTMALTGQQVKEAKAS
jgi:uncharacterized membrane protein HdeD (DUF308 family)